MNGMREALLSISALCMLTALCGQLMDSSRYLNCIRLVMGLEIVWMVLSALKSLSGTLV